MTAETDGDFDVEVTIVTTKPAPIKRWLSKPPRQAATAVLIAAADGGSNIQLGSWPVDEATPQLADEIVDAMKEYAHEAAAEVKGVLSWQSATCVQVGNVKAISARPERPVSTDFGSTPAELTGDARSLVVQTQKHLEVMMRSTLSSMNATLHQSRQLSEQAMELAADHATARAEAEERAENLRRERDKLRDEIDAMSVVQESDDPDQAATNAHQERIIKLLEPAIQGMMIKLMTGGGGPVPPPT